MTDLTGKVALITGATGGIGEVTARELARQGAAVLVHGRSQERIEATLGRIREAVPGASVSGLRADLSNLAEVRALAADVLARTDRLDLLINNAGVVYSDERKSADGYELQFAVNHLSHFLLTNLLLERIRETAARVGEARIINLSSMAHTMGRMKWNTLGRSGGGFVTYSATKLANLLFTYELARRLHGTSVTVNAVHPGVVGTGFARTNNPGALAWFFTMIRPFLLSAEGGARTTIWAASTPELKGVTGQYLEKSRIGASSKASHDVESQRRLWEVSERMTGLAEAQQVSAA